jgi:hypothetical protein
VGLACESSSLSGRTKIFKLSKKQIMLLIDTGVIDHTWQDTTHDDKMYKGTVSFKNREPLKEK